MAFRHRIDGRLVENLDAFKRIFPYVMKTRAESVVYFNQKIDLSETLSYLDEQNAARSREDRVTLFHVFLAVIGRILRVRPQMNRFIVGRRVYEHNDITVTFIVKKAFTEEAPEAEARVVLRGTESPPEIARRVQAHVGEARSDAEGADDRFIDFVASLPRPLIRLVAWFIQTLDFHNLLPRSLMGAIPLYTSCYVTNVGSIGIEPPYHHLFEFGNSSLFMAIGKMHKEPFVDERDAIVARPCVNVTFTLDERISEGFYYARSLMLFQYLVEHPSLLDDPQVDVDEVLAKRGTRADSAR